MDYLIPENGGRRKQKSWLVLLMAKLQREWGKRSIQLAGGAILCTALITCRKQKPGGAKLISTLAGILSWHFKRRRLQSYHSAARVPLSVLWNEVNLGQIQRALISPDSISFQSSSGDWKRSAIPSAQIQTTIFETLTKQGTEVSTMPDSIWNKLAAPAMTVLPFVYLYFVYRLLRQMTSDDKAQILDNVDTRTTFRDVAGIDNAVREVSELVTYLKAPHVYQRVGARPPRGILLYGPPGSGKTLLARAIAGEANCGGFLACSGSDFCDTYVGRGASRIRKLFDEARRQAQRGQGMSSAIIFIDEIDALAKARSSNSFSGNDERDQALNQLLTCMDGFRPDDDVTLVVIAATNRPDVLDPALLRRMDRQVLVGLPKLIGRQEILKVHSRRIQCSAMEIDWNYLAMQTDGFSGADLATVVNEAALLAVRQRGTNVYQHHLIQAVQKVRDMKSALMIPRIHHQGSY